MPKHIFETTKSRNAPDFAVYLEEYFLKKEFHKFFGIFYPPGEPISQHRLRCGPFAVDHYNFMSHCLVAAAISSR